MLYEINKDDTSLFLKSVRFPKPQIFVEIFCTNLKSPVWSRVMMYLRGTPILRPENSVPYFGYLGNWLSVLNKQAFKEALFLIL